MQKHKFTAIVEKENEGFTSLCPELDIASQGETSEEAKLNLKEAVELFLECASPKELKRRLSGEKEVFELEVEFA